MVNTSITECRVGNVFKPIDMREYSYVLLTLEGGNSKYFIKGSEVFIDLAIECKG